MALYIGLMSGTSMDAVDAALVDFVDERARPVAFHSEPYPADLRTALGISLHSNPTLSLEHLGRLDVQVGKVFGQAALAVLALAVVSPNRVVAVGSHGQTLLHRPQGPERFSWQIGDPNLIAAMTGIRTVADFRRADLALGGQGAPLVPAFHAAVFRTPDEDRVVLNIGGIANLTVLPGDASQPVTAFDCGPGNALLDEWAERHLARPFDRDGAWARRGRTDAALLVRLKSDPYFRALPPKSTGRDYFNLGWLQERVGEELNTILPEDLQATLLALTVETIGQDLDRYAPNAPEVLLCGGGSANQTLVEMLTAALAGRQVYRTDRYGLDARQVEASAFAWLAKRRLEGLPGNLPSVTGASRTAVLGAIYEGRPPGG
ncbi:MAG: anhydro-N-acetylmuramic acid kinase [Gammaproteobacteria bacterium]